MPTGIKTPVPAPWIARQATSSGRLVAAPQAAEAAVNKASAQARTRLPPARSPSQPEAGMTTATATR